MSTKGGNHDHHHTALALEHDGVLVEEQVPSEEGVEEASADQLFFIDRAGEFCGHSDGDDYGDDYGGEEPASHEHDYVPLPLDAPTRSRRRQRRQKKKAITFSGEDSEEARQDYINQLSDDEADLAKLVSEYQSLMKPGSADMEWCLDDSAAQLLRKRNQKQPSTSTELDYFLQTTVEPYGQKKKKGKNPKRPPREEVRPDEQINFRQLNRDIKAFVNDDGQEEMHIDPYPPGIRRLIHCLAHQYALNSRSEGERAERHCVLIKTPTTRLPRDLRRLDRFLESAQKSAKWASYVADNGNASEASSSRGGKTTKKGKSRETLSARVAPGTIVGSSAAPIKEDNIGNQMLRKLGWSPGQGLGVSQEGRTDPVEAVFRGKRLGLGG